MISRGHPDATGEQQMTERSIPLLVWLTVAVLVIIAQRVRVRSAIAATSDVQPTAQGGRF